MDFSKFKVSDWLLVGGGGAMLILGFVLPWSSFAGETGDGPFDYFLTGGIAWMLVVAVGVLALMRALEKLPDTQPWPLIFLAAAGVATLLMLIQVILGGREVGNGFVGVELDRGIGMYLALVWAAITTAGAFMSFQESGGDIKDLTDMNKLKSSFSGGSASSPSSGEAPAGDDVPPPPAPPADPAE